MSAVPVCLCSKDPCSPVCLWRCDLSNSDGTLLGQLLLGLLTGVGVCQVGVKVLIQNLSCLLAEVSSFTPDRKGAIATINHKKRANTPFHNVVSKLSLTERAQTNLASRNLERRIMTASHVLCFNCIWMALNLRWMISTIRSISLGEMGRVRDCSLSRFITWPVNSLHACMKGAVWRSGINVRVGNKERIHLILRCFLHQIHLQ